MTRWYDRPGRLGGPSYSYLSAIRLGQPRIISAPSQHGALALLNVAYPLPIYAWAPCVAGRSACRCFGLVSVLLLVTLRLA